MKKHVLLICFMVAATFLCSTYSPATNKHQINTNAQPHRVQLSEWDLFVLALIERESENDKRATGKHNDIGILQITPIYVDDVNRILKKTKYAYQDRFDVKKSLEMFYIKNQHYNPHFNIDKAIKLHNPSAGPYYRISIYKKIKEIRQREYIINQYLNFQQNNEIVLF